MTMISTLSMGRQPRASDRSEATCRVWLRGLPAKRWGHPESACVGDAAKASAPAPAAKPNAPAAVREKLVFEHLEPRLLLSDTPIPLAAFAPAGTLTINVHSGDLKVETVYSGGGPRSASGTTRWAPRSARWR
ncbi:LEPR-XLL domain-containing protein [Roseateles sp.]|uniref:LEPR-XLL domain-containing protein n=1 Tax=Roseateles sp. TaxID=1971397 RepID=UPI00326428BF